MKDKLTRADFGEAKERVLAGSVTGSFERPRWSTTSVEDNGQVHYGAGMPGSLCGCHSPKRKEVSSYKGVTCPECLRMLRSRP